MKNKKQELTGYEAAIATLEESLAQAKAKMVGLKQEIQGYESAITQLKNLRASAGSAPAQQNDFHNPAGGSSPVNLALRKLISDGQTYTVASALSKLDQSLFDEDSDKASVVTHVLNYFVRRGWVERPSMGKYRLLSAYVRPTAGLEAAKAAGASIDVRSTKDAVVYRRPE